MSVCNVLPLQLAFWYLLVALSLYVVFFYYLLTVTEPQGWSRDTDRNPQIYVRPGEASLLGSTERLLRKG